MKKLMIFAAAAAALAGGAFAQDAECQAGSAWGGKPGCGHPDSPPAIVNNSGGPVGIPNHGYYGTLPGLLGALGFPQQQVYGNGQVYVDPRTGIAYPQQQYGVNSRDRDGDGVRNSRDRYPDDPRYR